MKWVGQHIYDLVSRFRDDVYLEDISTSTETNMLVVDGDGKITKRAIDAIAIDVSDFMTNGANNYVVTATGTDAMNAEANLTFDGSTLNLTGVMDISPSSGAGAAALVIDNDATAQIALDIDAANIEADVINISADAVQQANVIDISCDALTTGSALKIEDDSSATGIGGARNIVDIYQKNTSAANAQALSVKSDGGQTAVFIDKNASGVVGQTVKGLHVDLDRTVPGSGTNAHHDIGIDIDVTSASLGTSTLKGINMDVVGATSGTSNATGVHITMSGADDHEGVRVDGPGKGFVHKNNAASATGTTSGGKLSLISNDSAAMGDDHRLGGIHFGGYDGAGVITAAHISAYADAAWSSTVNDTRLEFYTMDGDDNLELSLTLDSDLLATFAGAVTVTGALTGTLATVSQPNVTTLAGVTAMGTAASDLDITNDVVRFNSANANDPLVLIKNTADDATSGRLRFLSARGADGQDDDEVGIIQFFGYDDGTPSGEEYATIKGTIHDATSGQESGKLQLQVASHDGGSEDGLVLTGGSVDAEVDVTIGNGTASVTTIAGDLTVTGSDLTFDSVSLTAIQKSDESFVDNDTSLMTSAAIDDKINTKYSYSYMTWSASGVSSVDGSDPEWCFPNTSKGIYEEDWNRDENITATSTGTTTYAIARSSAVNALVIPHTGVCVGFHAHGRNDDNDASFKAGLFHLEGSTTSATNSTGIDYGNTASTHEATLRWIATADEAEASGGADGTSGHNFKGPCKLVSNTTAIDVTAGDALLPAIMGPDASDEIYVTMTIILKIPLTT